MPEQRHTIDAQCFCHSTITRLILLHFKFPLTPMGVLAPGSAHAEPSAQPLIDVRRNFPVCMSAESPSNISLSPEQGPPLTGAEIPFVLYENVYNK